MVKKSVKEMAELTAKNKSLQSKIQDLQNQILTLTETLTNTQKSLSTLSLTHSTLTASHSSLQKKLHSLSIAHSASTAQSTSMTKQNKAQTANLQILLSQSTKECEKNKIENGKLKEDNRQLRELVERLEKKVKGLEEVGEIGDREAKGRDGVLRARVAELVAELEGERGRGRELERDLRIKEQELMISKKVIEKQLEALRDRKQLAEQLSQQAPTPTNPQSPFPPPPSKLLQPQPLCDPQSPPNKQNNLLLQIETLKQQISSLEQQKLNPSNQSVQQYMIKVGASEALRRIVEQKNIQIKRLIREKAAFLRNLSL